MNGFAILPRLSDRARHSALWLRVLNLVLRRVIPFNRAHGFRIEAIGDRSVRTSASYRRSNHNHVRGIHACAIATVAEFSAGFLLLMRLDPAKYRLIMSKIEVDFHYQAKQRIFSESRISADRLQEEVMEPLQQMESTSIIMESRVTDASGNDIATARTTWQVKRWDRVRTKV